MRDVLKYTNFGQIRVGNLCLQPPPPSLPIITMFIILGLYHLPDRYNVIIIKDFFFLESFFMQTCTYHFP